MGCGGREGAQAGADASADSAADRSTGKDAGAGADFDAKTEADAAGGCVPATCATLHYGCGQVPDRCGGVLDCGSCEAPDYCGGGGFDRCGSGDAGAGDGEAGRCPGCTPTTCASLGYDCGAVTDGCGGLLNCGTCKAPAWCGGGGFNVCGGRGVDAAACVPRTCAEQAVSCGPTGDGCGDLLTCGTCTPPDECCGSSGMPGHCGHPTASRTPATCAAQLIACGPASDGCGNLIECGACASPQVCGGDGVPGQCGGRP